MISLDGAFVLGFIIGTAFGLVNGLILCKDAKKESILGRWLKK